MSSRPESPWITMGQFQGIDMRVGEVLSVRLTEETRFPCRAIALNLGELGTRWSIGQFALVPEEELLGRKVIACVNLAPRDMGPYTSEALVLGTPHPESPSDQRQAIPLYAHDSATPGDRVY